MYLPEKSYLRVIVITFYTALALVISYLFFRFLFVGLLPFLLGWVLAYLFQPTINFLKEKARIPKKLSVLLLVLVMLSVFGFLIFLIVNRIVVEFGEISTRLISYTEDPSVLTERVSDWFDRVFANIPLINAGEIVRDFIADLDQRILPLLQAAIPFLGSVVKSAVTIVPFTVIFLLITVISTFYISIDFKRINAFLAAQVSEKTANLFLEIKNQLFSTTFKYLRAYLLLLFFTFTELFVGFTIIGIEYSFVLAILVAIIDVLPVLGTGTVLIPWAIFELINKNFTTGIALLVLYGTITLVRQIIEPKIIGSYIGLYPLVTLIAIYLGARILGIGGIFLFPILAIMIKNLNDKGSIHLFRSPARDKDDALVQTKVKYKNFKRNKKQ